MITSQYVFGNYILLEISNPDLLFKYINYPNYLRDCWNEKNICIQQTDLNIRSGESRENPFHPIPTISYPMTFVSCDAFWRFTPDLNHLHVKKVWLP